MTPYLQTTFPMLLASIIPTHLSQALSSILSFLMLLKTPSEVLYLMDLAQLNHITVGEHS